MEDSQQKDQNQSDTPTQTSLSFSKSPKWRVKIYQLTEEGQWDDKGTGFVSVSLSPEDEGNLIVISETDDSWAMLETKIYVQEDVYQRQQDTLIVWSEPETGEDLALSFQDISGCNEIWEIIQTFQKKYSDPVSESKLRTMLGSSIQDLPNVTVENLDLIIQSIPVCASTIQKERFVSLMTREGYISKLFALWRKCDAKNDVESLKKFFEIFKNIVLLNDIALLESFFEEDVVLDFMGTLEYDPLLVVKNSLREFLSKKVVFKEIVPFSNPRILKRIHQTYQIQYLRDFVLPRYLDDGVHSTIHSLVLFNQSEIISNVQNDTEFLRKLFALLKNRNETSVDQRRDMAKFLQELLNMSKSLLGTSRLTLYGTLIDHGFFFALQDFLRTPADHISIRLSGIEMLTIMSNHHPSLIRNWMIQKPEDSPKSNRSNSEETNNTSEENDKEKIKGKEGDDIESGDLLMNLIEIITSETDQSIVSHACEILKTLLDTSTMEELKEKDSFLTLFYQNYVEKLAIPFSHSTGFNAQKNFLCDILAYCVQNHDFRMKYFLLDQTIITRISKLLHSKQKWISLAALRFIRALVGTKDEFYNRHLIKNNIFEPIVKVLISIGDRYNLLNSAIIELFEFIRKENVKSLVNHIVEKYEEQLKEIDYVDTFHRLINRYEQNQESSKSPEKSDKKSRGRDIEDEDDQYFNESDSEESNPTPLLSQHDSGEDLDGSDAKETSVHLSSLLSLPPRAREAQEDLSGFVQNLTKSREPLVAYEDGEDEDEGDSSASSDKEANGHSNGNTDGHKTNSNTNHSALKKKTISIVIPSVSTGHFRDSLEISDEVAARSAMTPPTSETSVEPEAKKRKDRDDDKVDTEEGREAKKVKSGVLIESST